MTSPQESGRSSRLVQLCIRLSPDERDYVDSRAAEANRKAADWARLKILDTYPKATSRDRLGTRVSNRVLDTLHKESRSRADLARKMDIPVRRLSSIIKAGTWDLEDLNVLADFFDKEPTYFIRSTWERKDS